MSWQDRPYQDENYGTPRPELRLQFRKPSSTTACLVLINIAVFLLKALAGQYFYFDGWLGLSLAGIASLKIWQFVSYMFVHGDLWHILFNMLMLYFIGIQIERDFGRKRFLQFYFTSGLVGGLAYLLLGALSARYYAIPVVGASGGVYGLLMIAMIFYPNMQIIFLIFPMPIRVFGAIMLGIFIFGMLSGTGRNFGGDVCHLGGALAAVGLLYAWGMMPTVRFGSEDGPLSRLFNGKKAWARKQRKIAEEQAAVDRILDKVHREGVASLTRREKKTLAQATRNQQERDRQAGRIDRV